VYRCNAVICIDDWLNLANVDVPVADRSRRISHLDLKADEAPSQVIKLVILARCKVHLLIIHCCPIVKLKINHYKGSLAHAESNLNNFLFNRNFQFSSNPKAGTVALTTEFSPSNID